MDKASIVRRIKQKFGVEIDPGAEQEEIDQDKPLLVPNRRDKRHAKRYNTPAGTTSVHDALRLGPRPGRVKGATGQPLWFRQMKYDAQRRKALEKVPLDRLVPAVGQIAADLFYGGYKNVWQLTQVEDVNELLKVGRHGASYMGVRSKELKHLRDYLVQQRVPVKWEV